MKKIIFINIICYILIFLFIYAALSKLMDYERFQIQIGQSPLLTTIPIFVAWFIPAIEFLISGLLVFRKSRLAGLYSAFGLMTLFTAYIVAILNFGVFVPCSCGGILQKMTWNTHWKFNMGFVIISAVGVFLETNFRITERPILNPSN
jgi:hypothetical protein